MSVDSLFHLPAPGRRFLYFALQRAIGSKVHERWREWQRWEKLSPQHLEQAIDQRLWLLLSTATRHSGYYRELGLVRRDGESVGAFLGRFPILTRETVRSRFRNLVVDALRSEITSPESSPDSKYGWVVVKTGGTTGVPTSVVHDAEFRDWGRASRLFSQRLCGFPLGERYFRLWGSERDLLQQEERLEWRILRNLLGEIPLNAFRAKASDLRQHVRTMESHPEIQHLMAYVDAGISLATFVEDQKLTAPRLKTIMACAGTVTSEWRTILQRVFQAEVFDKYGSRDCADIACECRAHSGLHVYSPNVYVEVVDEAGSPCPPKRPGRLLVTLLNNLSFPMIRYQIGDMATWEEPGVCSCGLAFPRLRELHGREDDMLTTEDGTRLSSVFIRHCVGVSLNRQLIREWQFEQSERNRFVFRYIPLRNDGLDANLRDLKSSFQAALGRSAAIEMEAVVEIPPSSTGKTLWILNRTKAQKS